MKIDKYVHLPRAFLPEHCDEVLSYFIGLQSAKINLETPIEDDSIRSTKVIGHPIENHVSYALWQLSVTINLLRWNLHVTEPDVIQLGEYTKEDHYDWHMDADPFLIKNGQQRKITAVLMLSDRSNYEGGQFEFRDATLNFGKGDVVVFPSLLEHRVSPVTNGTRRTMVCWSLGPALR